MPPVEPYVALPAEEYEDFLNKSILLDTILERFEELKKSKLHNRDNLIRFFKGVIDG